ncbi:LOW QUALITY PROTEIN: Fe-S-cluster-containing dehydrogenase component [Desulfitobacterium sp. LBE]|nr:LOW QUALITY PROTEIN: Fe-S-cluster-containing dehydrogenase component [Desulfitobacterium sp. LBE]
MKVFVIDVARCNGCYTCQIVCKDEHVDNDWAPIARPQPETGHFWMKMKEKTVGSVPKVQVQYTPTPCMHCDDAPCIKAGNGSVYKRTDGLVVIDPEKAQGDRTLVDSCPYGAIYWNDKLGLAQKCTGCAHLIDEGKPPRCAEACATDALKFGEEEDFKDLIAKAEVMLPESGTKPRVYYVNLPKKFVAGEVWDPKQDICIEDAAVTLIDKQTNKALTAKTDDFGDFWFKGLIGENYSLKIEKEGYYPFEMADIKAGDSINVGDIALKSK